MKQQQIANFTRETAIELGLLINVTSKVPERFACRVPIAISRRIFEGEVVRRDAITWLKAVGTAATYADMPPSIYFSAWGITDLQVLPQMLCVTIRVDIDENQQRSITVFDELERPCFLYVPKTRCPLHVH